MVVKSMQRKRMKNNQNVQRYVWQDLAAHLLSLSWGEFYCYTILFTYDLQRILTEQIIH